jgi:hypothetical protein
LIAAAWLQTRTTPAAASLLIAIGATAAAAGAALLSFRGSGRFGVPVAIVLALGISAAAIAVDRHITSATRQLLPPDKSWIDDAAHGSVAAIATPISSPTQLELQLFWNPSVNREVLLPDAIGSDSYATAPLRIGSDGSLLDVPGDFLFDFGGSTATFSNATQVAHFSIFGLYRPLRSDPRFRLLIEGFLPDHWLVPQGRIRAWRRPGAAAGDGTSVSFTLSLPRGRPKAARITLRNRRFTIAPGARLRIVCRSRSNPLLLSYASPDAIFDRHLRPLTVKLSDISVSDEPPTAAWPSHATACVPVGTAT